MFRLTTRQALLRVASVLALCTVAALPIACSDDDDPVDGGNGGPFDGTIEVRANFFSPAWSPNGAKISFQPPPPFQRATV